MPWQRFACVPWVCLLSAVWAAAAAEAAEGRSSFRARQLQQVDASFLSGYVGQPWKVTNDVVLVTGEILIAGQAKADFDIVVLKDPWEKTIERSTGGLCNLKSVSTDVQGDPSADGLVDHVITVVYELLPPLGAGWGSWDSMNNATRLKTGMWSTFAEELALAKVDFSLGMWDVVSTTNADILMSVVAHPESFVPAVDFNPPTTTTVTRTSTTLTGGPTQPPTHLACPFNCPEVVGTAFDEARVLTLTFCEDVALKAGSAPLLSLSGTKSNLVAWSSQVLLEPPTVEVSGAELRIDLSLYVETGMKITATLPAGAVAGQFADMCVAYESEQLTVTVVSTSKADKAQVDLLVMPSSEAAVVDSETIIRGALIAVAVVIVCCLWCVCVYVVRALLIEDDEDEDLEELEIGAFRRASKKLRRSVSRTMSSSRSLGGSLSYRTHGQVFPADWDFAKSDSKASANSTVLDVSDTGTMKLDKLRAGALSGAPPGAPET